MAEMKENKTPVIEKKLKRTKYNFFDACFACVCFIVLQVLVSYTIQIFRDVLLSNAWVYYLAQFLVEAVFICASLIVAQARDVEFVKASTYNKKLDYKTALIAVVISIVCIFGFSSLTNVFVYALEKFGYTAQVGTIYIPNFGIYILYVVLMCVVPAIFEETLFRSTILNGMREKGKTYAVMMSALIFMLMHGGPDQTIHQFILGVILGYVLVYSGTIWAPVLIHFLNNFYAVTAIYIMGFYQNGVEPEVVETTLPTWGELAGSLVIGVAMACLSGYIIYVCIKAIIKIKSENDKKDKEKFLALLDKEKLTDKEVLWLKKYRANVDEYENASNSTNTEVAKCVEDELMVQENRLNDASQDGNENDIVPGQKKKTGSIDWASIMLVMSIGYLAVQWFLTLIIGLMS